MTEDQCGYGVAVKESTPHERLRRLADKMELAWRELNALANALPGVLSPEASRALHHLITAAEDRGR